LAWLDARNTIMLRVSLLLIGLSIAASLSACTTPPKPVDRNSNATLATKHSNNRNKDARRVQGVSDCKSKPNYSGMLRTLCY
jgi:starvation-inducible outer membrane lipoprotein